MSDEVRPQESEATSTTSVSRSAFRVVLGGIFSLLTGLASQIVVAWLFGAKADVDAFLTASTVPAYLWVVLVGGLAFVFVPAFVKEEMSGSGEVAWALAGTVLLATTIFLTLIAIVGFFLAPQIIAVTAPGMSSDKASLSIRMLSILIFTVPLYGVGALAESIQNARGSFFWPATSRALGSLGNVAVLLLLHRSIGPMALAWGNLVSTLLATSVPLLPILRHGWTRLLPLTDSRIREMALLMVPFLLSGMISNSNVLFERYFASVLADGSLAYIGYAYKISSMLVNVLATGIAAAILPAMARAYTQGGESALTRESQYAFRLTVATSLPAVALISTVAVPLVTLVYERGAFDHQATVAVSQIVLIVMMGDVVFRMLGNVIGRTFYILKNTHTYPLINALSIGLYVIAGKVLVDTWDYVGLAIASPVQAGACVLVAFLLLSRRLNSLFSWKLLTDSLLYIRVTVVGAFAAWLLTRILSPHSVVLGLVIPLLSSSFLYMLLLFWLDREIGIALLEISGILQLLGWIRARWPRFWQMARLSDR